jgi:hypothetical protein
MARNDYAKLEAEKANKPDASSPDGLRLSLNNKLKTKAMKDAFTEESIARVQAAVDSLEEIQVADAEPDADLAEALESTGDDVDVKQLLAALLAKL